MLFKRFLIWSSGGPSVQWSGKEGIMGNIHVKLYEIRTRGSGGDVVLKKKLTDGQQIKTDHNSSPVNTVKPV